MRPLGTFPKLTRRRLLEIVTISGVSATLALGQIQTSNQPQWRAPWHGQAVITQGNHGTVSHYDHGTWDNTYAIDVGLPFGTDVLAPADGTVIWIKDSTIGLGGREMALMHIGPFGDSFIMVFLHLSQILVRAGAVSQGQVIARSGASSNGSEYGIHAHLHFHLWRSGSGAYDSHTIAIEALLLKRVGVNTGFRFYNALNGDLDDARLKDPRVGQDLYASNVDSGGGSSVFYRFAAGPPVHPAGTLVKTMRDATVYLLRGPDASWPGIYRLGIPTPSALKNPYNQLSPGDQFVFNNVITIADDEMSRYPVRGTVVTDHWLSGNGRRSPNGTLIIEPGGQEISIVSNGQRRPFSLAEVFLGLGYKFEDVIEDLDYADYPTGQAIDVRWFIQFLL